MMAADMPDRSRFPSLPDHLAEVRRRLGSIDRPWGHPIRIVAVTKGFDDDAVAAAAAAGCTVIGENYAQEILAKREAIARCGVEVHFIGHLQSRKIRQLTDIVSVWSSVDRISLVEEIAKRAPGARVRLQVNTTGEPQKGGCRPDEVGELVDTARELGLGLEGLMTVGPTDAPAEAARPGFATLRGLVDRFDLSECSMGMSSDLAVAVEEGTTEVRVGTALFGPRPRRT